MAAVVPTWNLLQEFERQVLLPADVGAGMELLRVVDHTGAHLQGQRALHRVDGRPQVVAHRGSSLSAAEHTLGAYEFAVGRRARKDGKREEVALCLRIDTPIEVDYYKHGGILPYVLRQLLAA